MVLAMWSNLRLLVTSHAAAFKTVTEVGAGGLPRRHRGTLLQQSIRLEIRHTYAPKYNCKFTVDTSVN